ncbi:TonB-dependent receptor plug domain-containing protein [Bartonella sp. HY761]|uniref:TonB-dependent receptor plug domain-containing protein n=1 Tax=Bartonella sp. HY761 TaxID=2979330 RepID=UPI002200C00A|nr:TonB-dependent receptor [Bartonella sp. HY761]UXN06100.1 TonB-dependent receptor [Bartonella sp. HY761]
MKDNQKTLHSPIKAMLFAAVSFLTLSQAALAAPVEGQDQNSSSSSSSLENQNRNDDNNAGVFTLGTITVFGARANAATSGLSVSESTVTSEDIRVYNRNTLGDALKVTPGVIVHSSGGRRNENRYYIRGFDMNQAPLMVDGVQIYLPYDNGLDINRFLTPDLSQIQVQKGYVSVLNGPGGMGGAVNLVTRRPEKTLEVEFRPTVEFGNTGRVANYTTYGYVGSKQDTYYVQASGVYSDNDGFFLSRHFDPVVIGNSIIENGGRRDFSSSRDWRGNLKIGFTPNDTDEYTINYTKQEGHKDSPYSIFAPVDGLTTKPPKGLGYQANWNWPQWDVETISLSSHTEFGEHTYLNTRFFYAEFDNTIAAYDDYHFNRQFKGKAFRSTYHDKSYGMSMEAGTKLFERNDLKAAFHFRRDEHEEHNINQPSKPTAIYDPVTGQDENIFSIAVENTFHATDKLDLVGGISYDYRDLKNAEYLIKGTRDIGHFELSDDDAINWQMAAIYRPTTTAEWHASVSSRTRFPTIKERFSSRFGAAVPNPWVKAERATNYEIGWSDFVTSDLEVSTAVFYNNVEDMIDSVYLGVMNSEGREMAQSRNVGKARYYGIELKAEWQINENLLFGGNYSYLKGRITSPNESETLVTGKPQHQAFIYGKWTPIEKLTISPSIEIASWRYSRSAIQNIYRKADGYVIGNISAEYSFTDNASLLAGVRNISDENYEVEAGYPEAGRTFFLSGRFTF